MDMIQLGLAISIINHEFNQTISAMRKNIRSLKGWADVNEEISPLYSRIRDSFEHIDGYMKLFTPLERRLHRNKTEFSGFEISKFLRDLFGDQMERHKIRLIAREGFKTFKFFGYRSSFYPVFVNLIDNSLYWLKDVFERQRTITLDFDKDRNNIIIHDNGPGFRSGDDDDIFKRGFTRKKGGRGLGLFIAREVLGGEGWRISAKNTEGAHFTIKEDRKEE